MKTFTKFAAAALALSVAAVPASQAFAASKTENALIGAAIGALGGALVSKGSTGVIAGAAIGAGIGLATDKPDRGRSYSRGYAPTYRSQQPVYRQQQPAYRSSYGYDNGRYDQGRYDQGYYGNQQARYYGYR